MVPKKVLTAEEVAKLNNDTPASQQLRLGDRLGDAESEGTILVDCAGAGPWPFTMPYDGDIMDMTVHCNVVHASGTLQLQVGASTAISDAVVCATNDAVTRAASLVAAAGNSLTQGTAMKIVSTNSGEGRVTLSVRKR